MNWCRFGYIYWVWEGNNLLENQAYKLSTCLESEKYINMYAKNDLWIYGKYLEYGNWIRNKSIQLFYIEDLLNNKFEAIEETTFYDPNDVNLSKSYIKWNQECIFDWYLANEKNLFENFWNADYWFKDVTLNYTFTIFKSSTWVLNDAVTNYYLIKIDINIFYEIKLLK